MRSTEGRAVRKLSLGHWKSLWWGVTLLAWGLALAGPAGAKSERYTFIISDTHFGVGRDKNGVWDAYEDARWPEDLASFLKYVATTGGGKADLIINGDVFELWQSRGVPCKYSDKDAGCSDADALRRFRNVVSAHAEEIKMLKTFASSDENKLTLIVGNHDVALLLPSVKAELVSLFGCPACKFSFEDSGVWQSDDGKVRAEHGHEIGKDLNAFDGWPRPFLQLEGKIHVRRPWGEQFVQEFYNQFEEKYPTIDNVTDELKAMRLGLGAEGTKGSAKGALEFLKFLALRESWEQVTHLLGGDGGVGSPWDVAAERAKGDTFLKSSFPTNDVAQQLLQGVKDAETDAFVRDPARLSDMEIRGICDARSSRKASGLPVSLCDHPLGNLINSAVSNRTATFRTYLGSMKKRPRVFVYSHTHQAERFNLTNPDVEVLNTGAWQRLVSPSGIDERARASGKKPEEILRLLRPEDLAACYAFVVIPPYGGATPKAELRSWRVDKTRPHGESSPKLCN